MRPPSGRSGLPPKQLVGDCREHVIQRARDSERGRGGVGGAGEAGGDR